MTQETEIRNPKVELATKDWTMTQLIDTEHRIEKAFHEQTQFLNQKLDNQNQKLDNQNQKLDNQTKWMIGLFITMTIAIIVAVLFKS
ncbi:MAG: hypothetical protein AAF806_11640 [Bacteroidota bacterium]